MSIDPEISSAFVAEIKTLEGELNAAVDGLKKNPEQPALFEKFGQVIDRIYGTATTLGFKELGEYCGMLKKTCYECAKSNNKRAQIRVLGLLETCMQQLKTLQESIQNPEAMKTIHHSVHIEMQKGKKLQEEIFKFTNK